MSTEVFFGIYNPPTFIFSVLVLNKILAAGPLILNASLIIASKNFMFFSFYATLSVLSFSNYSIYFLSFSTYYGFSLR